MRPENKLLNYKMPARVLTRQDGAPYIGFQLKCMCYFVPVQCFQDFSCSAAVMGNGRNVEYALHLLQLAGGNIQVRTDHKNQ